MRPVFLATALLLSFAGPRLAADDSTGIEFFEKKIRPALAEHCLKCHSAEAENQKKLKGGLRLDGREAILAGGDSGPAVVPGKPKESLLLKAMRYEGDTTMPPDGKLPAAVIADFTKWIEMGAPAPEGTVQAKKQVGLSFEEGRKFWSYKPVVNPAIPAVKNTAWPANNIDRFILARLEAKSLAPAPDADRTTLIRRVTYDLTGLPPTPEEVAAFVNDESADAYPKLVDRLIASPAFGERWGRHWLDVARFAESVTLRGLVFKEAWRYRDYVIDSFNRDVPFNQFIREQIAGDLLPAANDQIRQRQLVAATFLMLGNSNLEEQDKKQLRMDVVDEQLDVITKGFLAQTVTCARCHDHKFDPIPTRDYYAMAGVLRNAKSLEHSNVSKWVEVPLPTDPETEAAVRATEEKIKALQAKLAIAKKLPGKVQKGPLAVKDVPGIVIDDADAKLVGEWKKSKASTTYIGTGYLSDDNKGKGEKTVTFTPEIPANGKYEVRFAYVGGPDRADKVPVHVFSADGEKDLTINMKELPPIEGRFISLGTYHFEKDGQGFVIVSNEGTKGYVTADCVTFIPVDEKAAVKGTKADPESVVAIEAEIKKLSSTGKRPMAMAPHEEEKIEDCKIHIRGSVANQGAVVPRGVLTVANYGKVPTFPRDNSGRRELADWIAAKENPLTGRVIVNRAWHWLFGAGIVRTTDNFGTTGEVPCNPELLDYLATHFVAEGWSMKKLIRELVLSHTYRQAVVLDANAAIVKADPENRLFGRANRRRFEAECLRDTMLASSGSLSPQHGGMTFPASTGADYNYKTGISVRSVYLPVFRNSVPEIFEVFDFADPSVVVGTRSTSTVAPQALYMLNNPFVHQQSRLTARRLLKEEPSNDDARLLRAYQLTLGRAPTEGERSVAKKFLAAQAKPNREDAWTGIVHALFASADFRYLQ